MLNYMSFEIKHKSKGTHEVLIDEEDLDKVKKYNWTLNDNSNRHTHYAQSIIYEVAEILEPSEKRPNTTKKVFKYVKTIHLHRLIMGLGDYKEDKRIVNHINGNGLDNRKCNLEICDTMYNSQSKNCPNKNVGTIYFENDRKKWRFMITQNKVRHSKRFNTEEEAKEYRKNYL